MKKVLLLLFLALFSTGVFAQNNTTFEYGTEFIWGVNKNTSGGLIGGMILRKSKKISDRMFESIGIELMNIKHSKEMRWNSRNTGNFFIFAKTNYLYSIRAQYGREYILFKKSPDQGVEIKLNAAAGPSFGILSPYYVEVALPNSGGFFNSYKTPYDPSIDYNQIYGPGNLFQGLGDAKMRIGANVKSSLSFELGTLKTHVTGFEVGLLLDAYAGEIPLMAGTENRSVFPTAFITLFYGARK